MHLQATCRLRPMLPPLGLAPAAAAPERKARATPPRVRPIVEQTVADVFGDDVERLRQPTRGEARIALARQVAMYVSHVSCGLSLTEVGELFARDRTTVSHACSVIEKRRDDAGFDRAIERIELVVRVLIGPTVDLGDA